MKPTRRIQVVATDLDGTLIPTNDHAQKQLPELTQAIERLALRLVFVTGRHFESAFASISEFELPTPEAILCDVGTSVYVWSQGQFKASTEFSDELLRITSGRLPRDISEPLRQLAADNPAWQLRPQEEVKQAQFKQSFYCSAEFIDKVSQWIKNEIQQWELPFCVVASTDPFNGDGLIDVLPKGVAKGFALQWWVQSQGLAINEVVYSGDSGNDTAAFCIGVYSTIVGNASPGLVAQVSAAHPHPDRVFRSTLPSTAAVLDGLLHFCGS